MAACSASVAGPARVRPGIEVLLSDSIHLIDGKHLVLLTNQTGVDRTGRRDVDLLREAGTRPPAAFQLVALFSPEHGLRGLEDRSGLPDALDSSTGLPIYSLYSGSRPPNYTTFDHADILLIDLQDIGARYYTYPPTAVLAMREAARRGKRVIVLDRPNPIGGAIVAGNVRTRPEPLDGGGLDFLPLPMRHGMTMGEILRLANAVYQIHADLTVVPVLGWRRDTYYDATGLPWVKPSPNMPSLESAEHYPGTCLFEATNLSVGRGTGSAFQVIGAPWLDPPRLLGFLRGAGTLKGVGGERSALVGVDVVDTVFTPRSPTDGKYDGVPLRGLRFRVTDRARYDPTRLAVALLAAIQAVHADSLRLRAERFDQLAGGSDLRIAIASGRAPAEIWRVWDAALDAFRRTRGKYLLY